MTRRRDGASVFLVLTLDYRQIVPTEFGTEAIP
jgi:hypothetical protein